MIKTDLSTYDNSGYDPGRGFLVRFLWYYTNILFFKSYWLPLSSFKRGLLKLFGAKIGKGVVIKPGVNIKYPWLLEIGDYSWIGEGVWIDNLVKVKIGPHCCLSQGAMLLTGSHDYKKNSFDLITGEIRLEEGVWIGARAMVGPNVVCASHSVLSLNSVATQNLDPFTIYQGNPALKKRTRAAKS
jgi:putative colanic acid biosynthesis acetyltransferase WcaF